MRQASLVALACAACAAAGAAGAATPLHAPALSCGPAPAPAKDTTVCRASGSLQVNDKRLYSFDVPPKTGSVTVRLTPSGTAGGDADLEVQPPAGVGLDPKSSREVRWLFLVRDHFRKSALRLVGSPLPSTHPSPALTSPLSAPPSSPTLP